MRRVFAAAILLAGATLSVAAAGGQGNIGPERAEIRFTGEAPPPEEKLSLWYRLPAEKWLEALPIGNGRLGGMVFGGVPEERIQLNEDTLWSGGPKEWDNPEALEVLPEVRRLVFEGRYEEAHRLCKRMMGPYNQSYLPMADLRIRFDHSDEISEYRRDLNLDTAVATTRYVAGGVLYTREVFSSHPDQVIAIQLSADRSGALGFLVSMDSRLRFQTVSRNGTLVLKGRAPAHVDPNYYRRTDPVIYNDKGREGMAFECDLMIKARGGVVRSEEKGVRVTGADSVTLLLAADTSFEAPGKSPGREGRAPAPRLSPASGKTWEALRAAHVADHQALFRRVSVQLGSAPEGAAARTTDQRVAEHGAADPELVALHFQYGRYLLIASGRPGSQPPNLQGIWNDEVRPPWSSNWTLNINAEMNHWPAEVTNLPECHEPLFDLIRGLAASGRKTARVHYGARGWVAHHNTDLWRQSSPVGDYGHGDATWAIWPMAGPWLCSHLWQHFEFAGDRGWLRNTAYPLMKGAAEFCLDFLVDDGKGRLVTVPSTSPENVFITPSGGRAAVAMASTMDMTLIRDLFDHCIEASEILGLDSEFRTKLRGAREKLYPLQVAPDGRLQEWYLDFKDAEPHHRHLSHLWGLYPGSEITREGTPAFFEAAGRSLEARSDEGTGWSSGWKISLWARLGDGDHAFELIRRTLRPGDGGVYTNLFGSHPPFQMDGNFAFPAGIAEMLVQSHERVAGAGKAPPEYVVHLLPALPKAWPEGAVRGLRVRGNLALEMEWKDSRVTHFRLASPVAKRNVRVRVNGEMRTVRTESLTR